MQQAGMPTPLDDRPEIDNEINDYFFAFNRLSMSRSTGMGVEYLKISEIGYYWENIDRIGSLVDFIDIIQALDKIFVQYHSNSND